MDAVVAARDLSRQLLQSQLPDRWQHVTAVAAAAARSSSLLHLSEREAEILVASAWLHDIGYSPEIASTGFHPLDGAQHLRATGFPTEVANLVANHSCASVEAKLRGLDKALSNFDDDESLARDCLWHADLTTGPKGQSFTFDERVKEIRSRYGPDHLVFQVWDKAEHLARPVVERVEFARSQSLGLSI